MIVHIILEMGSCFCFPKKNERSTTPHKFSKAFPAGEKPTLSKIHYNDIFFYYLPQLIEIDKHLYSIEGINNDITRSELLEKLKNLINIIDTWNCYDEIIFKERHRASFTISLQNTKSGELTLIDKPFLIIEVQQGAMLKPSPNKVAISDVFCMIELTYKDPNNQIQILKRSEIFSDSLDVSRPSWKELFAYKFGEETNFNNVNVIFSLYYKDSSSKQRVQLGDFQTFQLSLFLDQEVYNKEVHFKDSVAKGTLALIGVRFQFIHSIKALQLRKKLEIEARIGKLTNIYGDTCSTSNRDTQEGINNISNTYDDNLSSVRPSMDFDNQFFIST